jgi:outer membrane protein OmpA-like peptidoglycan-associated protein
MKGALRSAVAIVSILLAANAWGQDAAMDDATVNAVAGRMDRAGKALAAIEGIRMETINDDNGMPAFLLTFDAGIVSASGTNELTAAAKAPLSKLAAVLTENKAVAIEVLGHSDNSKWRNTTAQQSIQRNLELSEKRARAVAGYLKSLGVADARFQLIEGKGESLPAADNKTAEGRAANRRIEVYLLAGEQMIAEAQAEIAAKAAAEAAARAAEREAAEKRYAQSASASSAPQKRQQASGGQGFSRGDVLLFARSSGADFGITSVSGYSLTEFSLAAGGGYFILDKLAITGEVQMGMSKMTDMDASTSFGLGLGARFYFMKGLYAGASIAGATMTGSDDIQGAFGAEAGYDIFLGEQVFIEPAMQISKGINLSSFEVADGITFGLALGIGVRF